MGRIVGIDLGTTYSCVAIFNEKKGVFEVLPNKAGSQTTASVVGLTKGGEVTVGEAAKRQLALDPESTVAEIKRHMGELGEGGKPYAVRFGGKEHSPEEISALILRELKQSAERALGEPVTGAVITVPAYFEEPQRQATIRAGTLAGLDVKRIINEPTAAAISYGHDRAADDEDEDDGPSKPIRLLIYDLGGGTFDVSVIEVERGNLRVKSTHGNHYLGGVDFDRSIATFTLTQIRQKYGVDVERAATQPGREGERGRKALAKIRADAEGYKKELSSQDTVTMSFPMLLPDPKTGEPVDVELELTRADFEGLIGTKIKETLDSVNTALTDARLAPGDIDEVILVGGSTRIPLVKRSLTRHFGKEPRTDIHPDLCVALGAAHEALKHVDVSTAPPEARRAVEEKVAEMSTVVDVTGHSLGVAVQGTFMSTLIRRQTPIPAMVTQSYTTVGDLQTTVNIQVYQGEDKLVSNNTHLREFLLDRLPALPAGRVQIDVTFALDSNGVLTVTAKDLLTGRQHEVEINDERLRRTLPTDLLPAAGGAEAPGASDVPAKYRKFVEHATQLLPRLDGPAQRRLKDALDALHAAVRGGSPARVEEAGEALMDTLFDVRP